MICWGDWLRTDNVPKPNLKTEALVYTYRPGRAIDWVCRSKDPIVVAKGHIAPGTNNLISFYKIHFDMAQCKTAVTLLLTHWSCCSLALSHGFEVSLSDHSLTGCICDVTSLRNSPLDRSPRLAKTASVQQSNCLCWSESPPINSSFRKFTFGFKVPNCLMNWILLFPCVAFSKNWVFVAFHAALLGEIMI